MSDAPIDPGNYIGGVTVVSIGDLRVARGKTRRPRSTCKHLDTTYDPTERRVWCNDCETDLDVFDAYLSLVEWHDGALKQIEKRHKEVKEAERFTLISRATKALDKIWRRRKMVPMCPHCSKGLMPEMFLKGVGSMSKEWAEKAYAGRRGEIYD